MKFSIKDFFSKFDQIGRFLERFIFCTLWQNKVIKLCFQSGALLVVLAIANLRQAMNSQNLNPVVTEYTFLYKQTFYKNNEAEICKKITNEEHFRLGKNKKLKYLWFIFLLKIYLL